ncbi:MULTISPECIES: cupin domain-containing protein [unclassified Brenneria]|uniref:cupin domain-containing protein n=1 Tax=unclassified Brenneria TaxID=2634434 RepID=UPI0029C422C9|nr:MULTISPECIES: cupin domain-containing protein [unclassified Brenneria]MDX5629704.1 cupin domain-containing protein [Brenneria sp. L3-3Z]MDX5696850.1 cupin domain-containing protein [Brenneria sp. L4-2C]MEE3663351.1 cupin domain-containing protein [Brenneria sp. g21c3]
MIKTTETAHDYRFGDNGPKYLIRGPFCDMGVVVLQPGQSFRNHRHKQACEVFYTLSGEVCLFLEGQMHILREGDVLQCDPGEAHFLINHGTQPWKGVFVKSPHLASDSHPAEPEAY